MADRFDIAGTDNRLLDQYRASPKLVALLKALVDDPSADLWGAFEALRGRLDIDAMQGRQLDLIGTIVGLARPPAFDPSLAVVSRVFTFRGEDDPNDADLGFDSLTDLGFRRYEGGAFGGIVDAPPMSDEDYRVLLRATIFLNTSGASVPELEFYGGFVLGFDVRVVNGFTQIALELDEAPSPAALETILQTLLPAAGIGITHISATDGPGGFGFDGAPNTGFTAVAFWLASNTVNEFGAWSDTAILWDDENAPFDPEYTPYEGTGFAFVVTLL